MRRLKRIILRPTLTMEEAEQKFGERYLTRADYDSVVEQSAIGTLPDGEPKFVFLRNVLASGDRCKSAFNVLRTLPFGDVRSSLRRRALQGSKGKELVLGWMDDSRTGPRLAARTWSHPTVYWQLLWPLLSGMGTLYREYLPAQWEEQVAAARRNGERLIGVELQTLVDAKGVWRIQDDGKRRRPIRKRDIPLPVFSTVTVNANAFFRSHADAKNESGLACLTTFGSFAGGELAFPRLRVAFNIQPGDLLIADTNREQHGNIAPLRGTRISVVAYLRKMS